MTNQGSGRSRCSLSLSLSLSHSLSLFLEKDHPVQADILVITRLKRNKIKTDAIRATANKNKHPSAHCSGDRERERERESEQTMRMAAKNTLSHRSLTGFFSVCSTEFCFVFLSFFSPPLSVSLSVRLLVQVSFSFPLLAADVDVRANFRRLLFLSTAFTEFYWITTDITEFHRVLLVFYQVLSSFTGFLQRYNGFCYVYVWLFYHVLLGFTGFYRVLPDFPGFYWVLPGKASSGDCQSRRRPKSNEKRTSNNGIE